MVSRVALKRVMGLIIIYMFYVYILTSKQDGSRYIGFTADLKHRLQEHNKGYSKYTDAKRPYYITWYSAFTDKKIALKFEKYLKSSSGYAFTNKHLINKNETNIQTTKAKTKNRLLPH